jgi:hypothetical protein
MMVYYFIDRHAQRRHYALAPDSGRYRTHRPCRCGTVRVAQQVPASRKEMHQDTDTATAVRFREAQERCPGMGDMPNTGEVRWGYLQVPFMGNARRDMPELRHPDLTSDEGSRDYNPAMPSST